MTIDIIEHFETFLNQKDNKTNKFRCKNLSWKEMIVLMKDEVKDEDLTISWAQPESTMKSMTQGTTASTFERTCEEYFAVVKVFNARCTSLSDSQPNLHSQVPEVDQLVPVLNVGGGHHKLLLLARLLAVVRVPQKPHYSLPFRQFCVILMEMLLTIHFFMSHCLTQMSNMCPT